MGASIKIKAPRDASSLVVAGEEYMVDKNGYITIPEILRGIAESHGYGKRAEQIDLDRVAVEAVGHLTAEGVAEMDRGDLLIYCDENNLEVPPRSTLDDLRKFVWNSYVEKQKILKAAKKN